METNDERLIPFMAVHPGSILKEELAARGLKQKVFAKQIDMQASHLNEVLKGKRNITPVLAERLESALGISASSWLALQKSYELDCINIAARDARERTSAVKEKALAAMCNLKALYKELAVDVDDFIQGRMRSLESAFGCDPIEFTSNLPRGVYKRSDRLEVSEQNMSTWLMLAVLAIKSNVPDVTYTHGNALEAAKEIALWTNSGAVTESFIANALRKYGISYNVVHKLEKVPVDAYSTDAMGYPAIVVTHRHDDMARLVFNVLHELGHIHLHFSKGNDNVFWAVGDDYSVESETEKEANSFAQDMLISRKDWDAIMCGSVKGIRPTDIIKHLRRESKARGLDFGTVSWRYRYETRCYALGIKARKIR